MKSAASLCERRNILEFVGCQLVVKNKNRGHNESCPILTYKETNQQRLLFLLFNLVSNTEIPPLSCW